MAEYALTKYAEDFGEAEGLEADDLTIRPANNGKSWLIVHKTGQYPVENNARGTIDLRSLYEMDQLRQGKVKQGVIEEQDRKQKDRAAGIEPIDRSIPPVRGGLFSGDTYEAIRKRDEEDRQASGADQGAAEEEEGGISFFESIMPPVRGGLFSGSDYDEMNRPKSDKD